MSSKLEKLLAKMGEQQRSTQAQIASLVTATASLHNDLHHKIVIKNPINVETVQPAQAVAAVNDFNELLGGGVCQRAVKPIKSRLSIKSLIQQT